MKIVVPDQEELIPTLDVGHSIWAGREGVAIDYNVQTGLSVRARNVLRGELNVCTYGDLFALTLHDVKFARNSGVKTWKEIDKFRTKVFGSECVLRLHRVESDALARWEQHSGAAIEPSMFPRLSRRARNVLFAKLKVSSIGGLLSLDQMKVSKVKGAGKMVADEILDVRREVAESNPRQWLEAARAKAKKADGGPAASSYSSLSEMLVDLVAKAWKMDDKRKAIMDHYMGLLNSRGVHTLAKTGDILHLTRERVRQIAKRIYGMLFKNPLPHAVSEVVLYVKSMFEAAKGHEMSESMLVNGVNTAFGWVGTTAFSIRRVLEETGVKIVELPEGRGLGLNDDGRFDWVAGYKPPTLTERRRAAIKAVLQEAGPNGLTIEDILAACRDKFPDVNIGVGNVNGCRNLGNNMDDNGTRMIGYDRGSKGSKTRYTLNTFFMDGETVSVLKKAGEELRAYMERAGLGIVSIWKVWRKFRPELPHDLPKLGFYMMMREVQAGGLEYRDYPRAYFPKIDSCESAYWWELYEYCMACGRKTATFAEIMSFFTDALCLQPSIALSCAFECMGLKKVDEESSAEYVISSPDSALVPPNVFLPAIREHLDFSLVSPKIGDINPYYLDENGKALTHRAYAKLFFIGLEENGFVFPNDMLAELRDGGWCNVHLKTGQAVLCPTHGKAKPSSRSYISRVFRFGDEAYFVYGDWSPQSKPKFDQFALRVANMAGIPFEPYDVPGMSVSCFENE